jgi:glucan phosphoethanolaminetransferase (alkaline phosphatase superfamily)
MSRTLRYLRILWTIFCGIACVLLIVLWVRSYWRADGFIRFSNGGGMLGIESASGILHPFFNEPRRVGGNWEWVNERFDGEQKNFKHHIFEFDDSEYPTELHLYVAHWLCALSFAVLSAIPWIPWSKRFTLRTLLTATTLVAVVLGLIVWLR